MGEEVKNHSTGAVATSLGNLAGVESKGYNLARFVSKAGKLWFGKVNTGSASFCLAI